MRTYPLESIGIGAAKEKQFKMIDIITRHFQGHEILTRGDLGVVKKLNKPLTTEKAEKVIAEFFNSEAALRKGTGNGADHRTGQGHLFHLPDKGRGRNKGLPL